ncbi:MAG: GAF domain-containing protein [Halorhabdus sp.]
MTSAVPSAADVLEKVDALGPPGTPVTTPEVAEGFDCTQRTIYNRLESLVEDGVLETKKVGANSRVWWRPVDGDFRRNGGASHQRAPVSLRDGEAPSVTADSEMAERIREFEWADTPLGPMTEWPTELRVAVDVMLGADEAIGIYWGDELILLYNDAWRELIGDNHPNALGQPAKDVFPEIWETIGPMFAEVLNGNGAATNREQRLPLDRDSQIEDAWFDYSVNPIPMVDGSIGGIFNVAVEVTERKRLEQELGAEKEKLDAAVENSPLVLFRMDTDLRYTWVKNPDRDFEDLDVLGKREDEFLPPEAAETIMAPKRRALKTGDRVREEVTYELPSRHATYDLTVSPIRDESGEITSLVCAALDITERKETERELQQQAELDAFRVDLTDAIRPLTDAEEVQRIAARVLGEQLDVDRAHYGEMLADGKTNRVLAGYARDDIPSLDGEHHLDDYGEYIADGFRADDTLVVDNSRELSELSEAERSMYDQAEIAAWIGVPLHKDGDLAAYFVVTESEPRVWTDAEVEMVEETADRTWAAVERARAEKALRESEARLSKILEQLPVGVGVLDADGNFELQNDRMEAVVAGDQLPSSDPEQWPGARALRGEDISDGIEFRLERDEPTRWMNVAAVPFREDGDVAGAIVTVDDITDRKQAEQKLAAELEAIKRLEGVSTQAIQPDDGDVVYDAALDTAVDMLDADFGSLQRLDPETNELELLTNRGFDEAAEEAWARVSVDDASTCGKALQTEEYVLVPDVEASEFMAGTADLETYRQTGIRAVQTTPLVSRDGNVLGMLSTHWAEPHEPSERDRHLLDVLARQAADLMEQRSAYEAIRKSERSLQRLNDATRELIDAETETVDDRVVPLVREVLDVEYAALWRYNDQSGVLDEHAVDADPDLDSTAGFSDGLADRIWETFVGTGVDVTNDLDGPTDGAASLRSRAFVPLGRHGVVCLGSTRADTFDERTLDLMEAVASTVETAWDRAESEGQLARQNEELQRLDRLNTLIRGIDRALVGADARETIEEVVCEQLATSDLYDSAWLATYDADTDTLRPQAWAGVDSGYLEDRTVTLGDASNDEPLVAAHRSHEIQIISDIATDARTASWREAALARGARSCITVPLVYEESIYGILTVYGRTPQPDGRGTEVLAELGDTIAHAIHAVETTTTRGTDSVVELTLRTTEARTPLARLAQAANCELTVEGLIQNATDDVVTVFFTASDVSPDDLEATSAEVLGIEDLDCLDDNDDGSLYRARLTDEHLNSLLGTREAVVRSASIDGGTVTLVVDLPETGVVSEFLDDLRGRLPDVELLARMTQTRPLQTQYSLRTALEARLTARQLEVLQLAYQSGFFESPRVQTGKDLSEVFDVSQPTFTYHLRESQRRLCEMVFEPA